MTGPFLQLDVVRQWVDMAEHDLTNARHTLTLEEDCPYDTVCFHAQQCAEKYLKALLTYRGIDPPRTHDITELEALLPAGDRVLPPGLHLLNPYAVETRYPGPWEPLEREDAVRAVEIGLAVRGTVRSLLPLETFDPYTGAQA